MQRYKRSRKKLLLLVLPFLILLIGSAAYAAINLSSQKPNQHSALKPGINIAQGEKDLVGWWKLNGNTKDSTPYSNDGINNHGATPTADRKGTANGAYSFNGTSDYIQTNAVGLPSGSAARSAFAWVYATGYPSGGNGLSMIDSFGENVGADLNSLSSMGVNSNGKLIFAGNFNDYTSNVTLPLNSWHLVGYTYAAGSSNVTLWYDGVPTTHSLPFGALATVPQTHQIGKYTHGADYWSGSVSDLRIYNRALSTQEIQNLYNSYNSQVSLCASGTACTVNLTAGLIGSWPFNGNANDATPYQNNGVVHNATLTAGHTGQPNSAYAFNGTNAYIDLPNSASLNSPTGGLSISAWVYPTGLANNTNYNIFTKQNYAPRLGYRLFLGGFGVVASKNVYAFSVGDGVHRTETGSISGLYITGLNQWYFLTSVFSSGHIKQYLNGSLAYSTTTPVDSIADDTTDHATIGAHNSNTGSGNASNEWFDGSIDDVRIYNRALSAAEVQALYNLPD